jgi:protoporphyrinogen IX oxidase
MLWIKALHVIFVVSWFAGLLYLPRLFVYHTEVRDAENHDRFCLMERRLYGITTLAMLGTWIFGIATVLAADSAYAKAVYAGMGWLHLKILLVLLLSGYHGWLKVTLRRFAAGQNTHSARFYRLVNEIPAVLLVAIVILVIVKPF